MCIYIKLVNFKLYSWTCSACYWTANQRTIQSTQLSFYYKNHTCLYDTQLTLRNIKLSYLQNINKTIKQLVTTTNDSTSNTESCTVPSSTPKTPCCRSLHRHSLQWTPPSQPLVTNARGPGDACRTSVYFTRSPLWSYSNQRMVPGSMSKKFLKLYRFAAKV
jgi:hypothetical protein